MLMIAFTLFFRKETPRCGFNCRITTSYDRFRNVNSSLHRICYLNDYHKKIKIIPTFVRMIYRNYSSHRLKTGL